MKDFRDLRVWRQAHVLTLQIYEITGTFPKHELYGLTSQIRRSSAAIGANIAEGCGKRGNAEFQRYLQIAAGSASELDYHLLLAKDLKFFSEEHYNQLEQDLGKIRRMLTALLQKVNTERFAGQMLSAKC